MTRQEQHDISVARLRRQLEFYNDMKPKEGVEPPDVADARAETAEREKREHEEAVARGLRR